VGVPPIKKGHPSKKLPLVIQKGGKIADGPSFQNKDTIKKEKGQV
jgi:hypothetical protein